MNRLLLIVILLSALSACSSTKQKVPQECEFNEDCGAGYMCREELQGKKKKKLCRDIYHPDILPPQKVMK